MRIINLISDLIFPRRCPVCDEVLSKKDGKDLICAACFPKIRYIKSPKCYKCGKQLGDDETEYCEDCRRKKHLFERGFALYDYHSVRLSMYRFKYSGRTEYAQFFGRDMAEHFGDEFKKLGIDAIVPVPMYAAKQRSRGFNQAEVLAKALGEELGLPVMNSLVKRVKKTLPMKMLSPAERSANLKNAFIIGHFDVKLRKILVVDDIYTTGCTSDAVAEVLKAAGISEVYFAALSIGEGF
ncbi:MAG: ComF family protein [Lachnospiraceae bacterium]|nr:ComF family protein [Lachnospiraceae bacterium]